MDVRATTVCFLLILALQWNPCSADLEDCSEYESLCETCIGFFCKVACEADARIFNGILKESGCKGTGEERCCYCTICKKNTE